MHCGGGLRAMFKSKSPMNEPYFWTQDQTQTSSLVFSKMGGVLVECCLI